MTFTIPGKPIAKARPRFFNRGKFMQSYNPQETEEGRFMQHLLHQMENTTMIDTPLSLTMVFTFERPKGHMGTGRNEGLVKDSAPNRHAIKPDLDNLVKFAMDCMTGTVYEDDKQVDWVCARKLYHSTRAETRIQVEALYPVEIEVV